MTKSSAPLALALSALAFMSLWVPTLNAAAPAAVQLTNPA